mmetsp:Transcript_10376/g.20768  ORF Transcript_10376/g.20768 Transcript_10376/m.20768 type:complete len:189 (+) Transcript_10376:848-1414(+)
MHDRTASLVPVQTYYLKPIPGKRRMAHLLCELAQISALQWHKSMQADCQRTLNENHEHAETTRKGNTAKGHLLTLASGRATKAKAEEMNVVQQAGKRMHEHFQPFVERFGMISLRAFGLTRDLVLPLPKILVHRGFSSFHAGGPFHRALPELLRGADENARMIVPQHRIPAYGCVEAEAPLRCDGPEP